MAPQNYRASGDVSTASRHDKGHAFIRYFAFDKPGTFNWAHNASRNGIFVRRSLDWGKTWEPKRGGQSASTPPFRRFPLKTSPISCRTGLRAICRKSIRGLYPMDSDRLGDPSVAFHRRWTNLVRTHRTRPPFRLAARRQRSRRRIRGCGVDQFFQSAIRIGIIGDFEPAYDSHFATNAALYDAATKLKVPVELRGLPTPSLEGPDAKKLWARRDGLFASPGSPYKSFNGMLRGIEFARSQNWPFVGT